MKNEQRQQKIDEINSQFDFCKKLVEILDEDFKKSAEEQDNDRWNDYPWVNNRSRFANDVIRIRREFLKLEKMFLG